MQTLYTNQTILAGWRRSKPRTINLTAIHIRLVQLQSAFELIIHGIHLNYTVHWTSAVWPLLKPKCQNINYTYHLIEWCFACITNESDRKLCISESNTITMSNTKRTLQSNGKTGATKHRFSDSILGMTSTTMTFACRSDRAWFLCIASCVSLAHILSLSLSFLWQTISHIRLFEHSDRSICSLHRFHYCELASGQFVPFMFKNYKSTI